MCRSNNASTSAGAIPAGSPPGRTAAHPAGRWFRTDLDRAETHRRPRQQAARLHGRVGSEPVATHRVDERARGLDVGVATGRQQQSGCRAPAQPDAQLPRPPHRVLGPRLAVARGRREVGEQAIGHRVEQRLLVADPAVQRYG